jgi:glycosyltransferase involved in cell wall biosynthesis
VIVPAFSEGFGLPIAEAFAEGTPVACSDSELFREVAGDFGTYFDPYSPSSIAEAVNRIAHDKAADREELRRLATRYDVNAPIDNILGLLRS